MDAEEKKIKHIELIHSNIVRMNQCSFQMKGWMLTIVTALLALYANSFNIEIGTGENIFIFIAIIPTFLFWAIDSYYLQQERKFRGIYDDVISNKGDSIIKEFEMPLSEYKGFEYCIIKMMFSKSEWILYLPIIIGLIIAGYLL